MSLVVVVLAVLGVELAVTKVVLALSVVVVAAVLAVVHKALHIYATVTFAPNDSLCNMHQCFPLARRPEGCMKSVFVSVYGAQRHLDCTKTHSCSKLRSLGYAVDTCLCSLRSCCLHSATGVATARVIVIDAKW